ncbi:MAG TPA: 4-(cytidine 5'-diphospho)-2-C-methyl-D-erythritol kinase, partial [Nitrobacter sp.]|nr:4-(cytidine 5'-diphospho)-2-C-methyl-D-erythritol kinase [Nitrobacter sp.]
MIVTGATNTRSAAPALSETARAKVNLTLRVVGRRADGFHDLESVVAFADCVDHLTLMPGTDLSLVAGGPRAQECGQTADNLVLKAARLFSERIANLETGVFALDKHLPVAAGIGGGSADAAAALRLLARANGIAIGDQRLIEAARLTGADVPVCVRSEACVMTGVGEALQPLSLPTMSAVLVNPRVPVATKDVFAALGLRNGELHVGVSDVIEAIVGPDAGAPTDDWLAMLADGTNDLEAPAIRVQPVIGEVLARLRATGARLSRMSGSGATCFAIFGNEADA